VLGWTVVVPPGDGVRGVLLLDHAAREVVRISVALAVLEPARARVVRVAQMRRDASGQPIGVVTTCEDIADRWEAEEALRESEERYALAARGTNDGLWDWNLRTGRAYFSPRWQAMLGHDEAEVRGKWIRTHIKESAPQVLVAG